MSFIPKWKSIMDKCSLNTGIFMFFCKSNLYPVTLHLKDVGYGRGQRHCDVWFASARVQQ